MFNKRSIKFTVASIVSAFLAFSIAPAAQATPSLGSNSNTLNIPAYQPATLNTLLGSNPILLSGYGESDILQATITTTTGEIKITNSGVSAVTGYQSPVTQSAATIAFSGTQAAINTALNTLIVTPGVTTTSSHTINITVSNRGTVGAAYNPTSNHYYEFVSATSLTWENAFKELTGINLNNGNLTSEQIATRQAQTASSGCIKTFNGMCGYLATVTSEAENTFITTKVGTAAAWLGGSDRNQNDSWIWYDPKSPEYGTQFSSGNRSVESRYVNWNTGEPNNYQNSGENSLQILTGGTGKWNDLRGNSPTMGYVVEYGGISSETPTISTASRTINFSETFNVAYDANQGTGSAPAEGWYTVGQTFTVPGAGGLSRDGYAFDGWYDGTNKILAGSTYTMPAYNRSFQAQWVVSIPVQKDSVTAVTPAQGVQGTIVTISGSFTRKVTQIKVDTALVDDSQITQTATSLSFAMPRHLYGAATIYVINGAEPALNGLAFKYLTAAEAAAASPSPSPSSSAKPSATPSPSASATASSSSSPKPSSAAAVVPYNGTWGVVTFSKGGNTLTTEETNALNELIKGIADMAGTKVIEVYSYNINTSTNKSEVKTYNSAVTARKKLIMDALKAKVTGADVRGKTAQTKAPANLKTLKTDLKWLQLTIKLKVS